MRPLLAVVLALLSGALVGCFGTKPEHSASFYEPRGPFEGPTGDDVVQLEIAILERPYGDRFLNYELWDLGDEQVVPLERKPILEDNGFRVCQIGGLPPAGLHALLTSPRSNIDPRLVRTHAGSVTPVVLGPVWESCSFAVHPEGGRDEDVKLEKAQCLFEVVPTLGDEGRVGLRFTPHVRHGQASIKPRAAPESPEGPLCWKMEASQPEEAYPALGWEVTLGPAEYIIIGARLDQPDTLGQRCFLPPGSSRCQRLLVLRAARAPSTAPTDESLLRAPPLALQAGWCSARGSSQ